MGKTNWFSCRRGLSYRDCSKLMECDCGVLPFGYLLIRLRAVPDNNKEHNFDF